MAPIINMLDDIDPTKTEWAFKVRVVRLWENPSYGNSSDIYSLEMIFVDRKGTRIQATVKRNLIKAFKSQIREGVLYLMRHFVVGCNNSKFKATNHKYKLNFMMKTEVREVTDNTFPSKMYDFRPFGELLTATETDETILFDIIGEVVAKDSVRSKEISGRITKMIDVVLEDLEHNRLSCTLWGDYAEEVGNILESDLPEPAILLLQMCRAKIYRGEVRICNTYYITKVMVNADVDEVKEFRTKLCVGNECVSQRISQISSGSVYSIQDDLASAGCEVKTVEQLFDVSEVCNCWVFATIVAIENDHDWCYLSCKKCSKKVTAIGKRFHCEKCERYDAVGVPRYKIQVRVIDGTGSASFLLWDRECVQLIGKSAHNLKEEMIKTSENVSYPNDIEALVDQKMLFKVQVRDQNVGQGSDVFTVLRLTTDDSLISKYVTVQFPESQGCEIFMKNDKIDIEDLKDSMSDAEVNTPNKNLSNLIALDEVDINSSVKRKLDMNSSTQMSTNKARRFIK